MIEGREPRPAKFFLLFLEQLRADRSRDLAHICAPRKLGLDEAHHFAHRGHTGNAGVRDSFINHLIDFFF